MRDEILFTPEEVAQKLKLSKYTIYEMIKRGEISAHRIGRSLRVTESQLEAYNAIFEYAFNGTESEATDGIAHAMFILMKPNIDSSNAIF